MRIRRTFIVQQVIEIDYEKSRKKTVVPGWLLKFLPAYFLKWLMWE